MREQSASDDERILIEQARDHPESFQELYRRYFPRVYAYVAYRVASVQDAEDVVSTVFLKVLQGLEQFEYRGEGSLAAWIFRIAYRQILDFRRRNRSEGKVLSLDALPDLQDEKFLFDGVAREETLVQLRRLIAMLSSRRQEVITLKFFGGLRNKQIAEILGLDERSVASHLCRGLEDLYRKYLDIHHGIDREAT